MRRLHDGEKLILVVLILHPQSEENGSHVVSHTVITFLFQHPLHTRFCENPHMAVSLIVHRATHNYDII